MKIQNKEYKAANTTRFKDLEFIDKVKTVSQIKYQFLSTIYNCSFEFLSFITPIVIIGVTVHLLRNLPNDNVLTKLTIGLFITCCSILIFILFYFLFVYIFNSLCSNISDIAYFKQKLNSSDFDEYKKVTEIILNNKLNNDEKELLNKSYELSGFNGIMVAYNLLSHSHVNFSEKLDKFNDNDIKNNIKEKLKRAFIYIDATNLNDSDLDKINYFLPLYSKEIQYINTLIKDFTNIKKTYKSNSIKIENKGDIFNKIEDEIKFIFLNYIFNPIINEPYYSREQHNLNQTKFINQYNKIYEKLKFAILAFK